ncbi:MAG: adenosylcobalamin-dependent ribonucleoside-diphosphate reductase [Chloroflexota bacterium]|nr:MAG: adenosylcobalamin-dependent ribonucleoside-diphosphate reductase [Chloroflexota bacterium]
MAVARAARSNVTSSVAPPTDRRTELSGIRAKVFLDRYSLKDRSGTATEQYPEEMWWRVARGIAAVEKTAEKRRIWAKRFFDALSDFKFVPGGRILAGAGTGHAVTYYNCYVIPSPEDSRSGILDNLKVMTEIMARGGGVGINLSSLRPRGSYIRTVNGTASGPCSWAELYSVATGDVIQQGGSRRGALMLMLDDDHPDIEEFITVKQDFTRINHANLSVCVSDAFMQAIEDDADWQLKWQGEVRKTVKARHIWDLICRAAWRSAEPGVVFMDRYNKQSNTWYYENIRCVNPCGEQGLPAWGVCNLGALNLSAFVEKGEMDWSGLADHARVAMRFLDNVVNANLYFIKENEVAQMGTRRTGLGTMGLGDALIKLGVRYGSDESLAFVERIYATIRDAAYDASADIAAEKGPFGFFDRDKYMQGEFIQRLPEDIREKVAKNGTRNAVLLTQAPTGTTSLLSGVSSGIEPVYDFVMRRRDRTGEHILYHPLYQEWRDQFVADNEREPTEDERPHHFVGATELTPEEHVRVQAVVQKYTDSSISKTVNAPNRHTTDDVKNLYTLAYKLGCKGVAYFRDGSREGVLSQVTDNPAASSAATAASLPAMTPDRSKSRPELLSGYTRQVLAPEGKVNLTLNSDDSGLYEVFVSIGRSGSDLMAMAEAVGRLVSYALQIPSTLTPEDRVREIARQLRHIGGRGSVGFGPMQVRSLPDAIAIALTRHLEGAPGAMMSRDGEQQLSLPIAPKEPTGANLASLCPSCGSATLVYEEGCKKCYGCGHSEC